MRKNISICFFIAFMILNKQLLSQNAMKKPGKLIENRIYIVDTIIIKDPIVLIFKEKTDTVSDTTNVHETSEWGILLSKSRLDSIEGMININFEDFILQEGYLIYTPSDFLYTLEGEIYRNKNLPNSYSRILKQLYAFSKKDTSLFFINKRTYKGWQYYEVKPTRYLLYLLKGSVGSLFIDDELDQPLKRKTNLYYKALVPILW